MSTFNSVHDRSQNIANKFESSKFKAQQSILERLVTNLEKGLIDVETFCNGYDSYDLIKGGKRAQVGEERVWGGKKYRRLQQGWEEVTEGKNPSAKPEEGGDKSKKPQEPQAQPTGNEPQPGTPEHHAKNTPSEHLHNFIKTSKDEALVAAAKKELESRGELDSELHDDDKQSLEGHSKGNPYTQDEEKDSKDSSKEKDKVKPLSKEEYSRNRADLINAVEDFVSENYSTSEVAEELGVDEEEADGTIYGDLALKLVGSYSAYKKNIKQFEQEPAYKDFMSNLSKESQSETPELETEVPQLDLGTTKSGKPIKTNFSAEDYKNYSDEDHEDVARAYELLHYHNNNQSYNGWGEGPIYKQYVEHKELARQKEKEKNESTPQHKLLSSIHSKLSKKSSFGHQKKTGMIYSQVTNEKDLGLVKQHLEANGYQPIPKQGNEDYTYANAVYQHPETKHVVRNDKMKSPMSGIENYSYGK